MTILVMPGPAFRLTEARCRVGRAPTLPGTRPEAFQPILVALAALSVVVPGLRARLREVRGFRHGAGWAAAWGAAQLPWVQRDVWSRWVGRRIAQRSPYVAQHRAARWYEW